MNLGDLGPDALAAFDAANEGREEEDDDEDDAGLHPVSQIMFPLDEGKEAAAATPLPPVLGAPYARLCPRGTYP